MFWTRRDGRFTRLGRTCSSGAGFRDASGPCLFGTERSANGLAPGRQCWKSIVATPCRRGRSDDRPAVGTDSDVAQRPGTRHEVNGSLRPRVHHSGKARVDVIAGLCIPKTPQPAGVSAQRLISVPDGTPKCSKRRDLRRLHSRDATIRPGWRIPSALAHASTIGLTPPSAQPSVDRHARRRRRRSRRPCRACCDRSTTAPRREQPGRPRSSAPTLQPASQIGYSHIFRTHGGYTDTSQQTRARTNAGPGSGTGISPARRHKRAFRLLAQGQGQRPDRASRRRPVLTGCARAASG
jgi:hypothetical protein